MKEVFIEITKSVKEIIEQFISEVVIIYNSWRL